MATWILSRLPSVAYPPSQEGRWSPVTSTINWCEEDYYATRYAAEVVNTFTNLLFMYLATKGIRNCLKHGHDTIFVVTFIGYLLVGTGSFFFHASLKYPMQLIDELNMIYTTFLQGYITFSYGRSKLYAATLALSLISVALFITMYYHYVQDPTFHQTIYAVSTAIILGRSIYLMEMNVRPKDGAGEDETASLRSKSERARQNARDQEIVRRMWTMIVWGLSIFLGGFALWGLDRVYCSTLIRWRREIGMPWGFVLEAHGWWHLMTGTGAYFYIVWNIWLRYCLNRQQDDYVLVWPAWYSLPEVVRSSERRDFVNGRTKKEH